jgi:hypothetical protein
MMASTGWQIEDRGARQVRRALLCVGPGAPRHRLAASMEEALRLAVLPGESQGRVYYFRRVNVIGLPPDGDRRVWLDAFQRALMAQAVDAVFGADPRADLSPAVFFRSRQEALEILLHRVIARHVVHEWFWPMVMRETHSSGAPSYGARAIPGLIEALRAAPAAWVAVAAALFDVPRFDVAYFLHAIPVKEAETWLAEMDRPHHVARPVAGLDARPVAEPRISMSAQRAVQEALRVFGFNNPLTVWITTLAILHGSSAAMAEGAVVEQARAVLARLVSTSDALRADAEDRTIERAADRISQLPPHDPAISPINHRAEETIATATSNAAAVPPPKVEPGPIPPETHESPADRSAFDPPATVSAPSSLKNIPNSVSESPAVHVTDPSAAAPESVIQSQSAPVLPAEPLCDISAIPSATIAPAPFSGLEQIFLPPTHPWRIDGLPTQAAGLFFLLNALSRIGIEQAITSGGAEAAPNFVPRILARLAAHSGILPDDPIAVWLTSQMEDDTPPSDRLLRVWALAVRRWCWRNGKITVSEIVARPGIFSVNRTGLDISLPLEEADVRIRRIGLDLDPGWLPWFGRVVRFHYPYRRELNG